MKEEESQAVFFIMLFILGIYCLVGMAFVYPVEVIRAKKMRRCYKKNRSEDWGNCYNKSCFGSCCALQERDWLANLERQAGNGDKEALASLEFYYRYG